MFTQFLAEGVEAETSKRRYNSSRDVLAWKLSKLTSQARGRIVEKAVAKELERHGFTGVKHIGGTHPFDIDTDQGHVEVKSSLVNTRGEGFLFQRIEPTSFNLLVMVGIHPDWIEIKAMSRGESWNMVNNSKSISMPLTKFTALDDVPELNYTSV
jgi:hypothetical protein